MAYQSINRKRTIPGRFCDAMRERLERGEVVTRSFWIGVWLVLPLLLPVQAQVPYAKPVTTDTARTGNTSPPRLNIYVAGGNVRPAELVKGDLYAAGGRVTIEHPVQGDATLAGGAVTVRAPIGEDLRTAGGDVTVESTVGGELYASGGSITLRNTAVVAQAVTRGDAINGRPDTHRDREWHGQMMGSGACALELYGQVRSGRKPTAQGSTTTVGA